MEDLETREIIVNGISRGELSLPFGTSENVWAEKMADYKKNTNLQKVEIMHKFNSDFKIFFISENIDFGISKATAPDGYTSMREFIKEKLSPLMSDIDDFSYPEAFSKIEALKIESLAHPEWSPFITFSRLEICRTKIVKMLGSL